MKYESEATPLLTIVIPTRNRMPYAISAIQSILEIADPRLELVVQDNSDSRDLEGHIRENILDNRLRYRYTPPPLSSIDNFNAAMELATGEYLCLIGDDDGVNPEIMAAAAWASREGLDALVWRTSARYLWPGSGVPPTLCSRNSGGTLTIRPFLGSLVEPAVNVERETRMLLREGGIYYRRTGLPTLYHGLVHRRCLQAVYEKIGAYFGGLSPDIFAVLTIANFADRVAVVDYPLSIPGTCSVSGTAWFSRAKRAGRLEDAPPFRNRGEYHWCELVPRVYTEETVTAESGIAALRAVGREDLVRELNLSKLAAYCIADNDGTIGPVVRDMFSAMRILGRNRAVGTIQLAWSLISGPGARFGLRVWNRFLIVLGRRIVHSISGLENMVEASHALTGHLKENGHTFGKCVREGESRC